MDKMDNIEKLWGGLFGIAAIVAAIVEMFINGVNASSVISMIKDVSGTMVVVLILIAFINNLPKKPKNLTDILAKSVEDWGNDNVPLIFKTENYVAAQNTSFSQGFVLLQDPRKYVKLSNQNLERNNPEWKKYAEYGNSKFTGKFLDLPNYEKMTQENFNVAIIMEQSHFKKIENIDEILDDIRNAISSKCVGCISASRSGKSLRLNLSYKKIESIQDIEAFVDALDFILSLVKVIA